jgi:hypothetical protein
MLVLRLARVCSLAAPRMLFGVYWLLFRFIIFFLFFVNRTDDGASFCIAPSLLLRFFALWIVNHDSHLEIGCVLSLPQFRKGL